MTSGDYLLFDLGDFALESGARLPGATLAYKTYGTLSPEKDNAILFPGAFNGPIADNERWIAPGRALDPNKYFIIVTGLFGNGQSASPGNMPSPFGGPNFPNLTIGDNVNAQYRLVTEAFGIERLQLVTGFSMGAMQVFHWGAHYPDRVERIAPFCGAARCSRHNYVFLAGLKAALTADGAFDHGRYTAPPAAGLAAFGRVYAGWVFSQAFFRERIDIDIMGYVSAEDHLSRFWDHLYAKSDANSLLSMVWTWQNGDIAAGPRYGGDFTRALAAIRARAHVMPSTSDLYFPVADSELEVAAMPNARLVPIPTIWGHIAGVEGSNPADTAFIEASWRDLLGA